MMIPELVADARCILAEGPLWHPDEGCLYWTDIPAGTIYRFDPESGDFAAVHHGEPVGGMTLQADGSLLLFGAAGRVWRWRKDSEATVVLDLPDERQTRFNDVIADPVGRAIAGTMAVRDEAGTVVRHGRLYSIDPDGTIRVLLDDVVSPNGMSFTEDRAHLYFTDSAPGTQSIFRFDYDLDTGGISNRRLVRQTALDGSEGRPDGLTIDREGWLWSARWDGSAVIRLDPNGTEQVRYPFPVPIVTSVTFGGSDLRDLYATTARPTDGRSAASGVGGIFRLRTDAQGRPEFRSRLGL